MRRPDPKRLPHAHGRLGHHHRVASSHHDRAALPVGGDDDAGAGRLPRVHANPPRHPLPRRGRGASCARRRRVGVGVGAGVEQPQRLVGGEPGRVSGRAGESEHPGVLGDQLPVAVRGRQRELEPVADQQQRGAGGDGAGPDDAAAPGRAGAVGLGVEGGVEDVVRRARRRPGRCGPAPPRRVARPAVLRNGTGGPLDRPRRAPAAMASRRPTGAAAEVGGEVARPSRPRQSTPSSAAQGVRGRSRGPRSSRPSASRMAATSRATSSGWMRALREPGAGRLLALGRGVPLGVQRRAGLLAEVDAPRASNRASCSGVRRRSSSHSTIASVTPDGRRVRDRRPRCRGPCGSAGASGSGLRGPCRRCRCRLP